MLHPAPEGAIGHKDTSMANQEESKDGMPRKDGNRPSPDVERHSTDGQGDSRGKGASDEQGRPGPGGEKRPTLTLPKGEEKGAARGTDSGSQDYRGEGPGKVGLTSDKQ